MTERLLTEHGKVSEFLKARRSLSSALREWESWCQTHSAAKADEVWHAYWEQLRPAWDRVNASDLGVRIHPAWRTRVAKALVRAAIARLELEPFGLPGDLVDEAFLWESALSCSAFTVRNWEPEQWTKPAISNYSYQNAEHRLADIYRRCGRTDHSAVSLYIEVFTGAAPSYYDSYGLGGHHVATHLIEQGARIKESQHLTPREARLRYGLCLRLSIRRFGAEWVSHSLQLAHKILFPSSDDSTLDTNQPLQESLFQEALSD